MRALLAPLALFALAGCAKAPAEAPASKALSCAASADGAVTVSDAWIREQPDERGIAGGYFTICNESMADVVFTALSTPAAGVVEVHETTRDANGVVSMAPAGDITLKPGEQVIFEPGGKHAMLMSLSGPIAAGDVAEFVFHFADGATTTAEAVAKSSTDAVAHDKH